MLLCFYFFYILELFYFKQIHCVFIKGKGKTWVNIKINWSKKVFLLENKGNLKDKYGLIWCVCMIHHYLSLISTNTSLHNDTLNILIAFGSHILLQKLQISN